MPQHLLSSGQSFVLILIMPSSSRIMRRLISACWRARCAIMAYLSQACACSAHCASLKALCPNCPLTGWMLFPACWIFPWCITRRNRMRCLRGNSLYLFAQRGPALFGRSQEAIPPDSRRLRPTRQIPALPACGRFIPFPPIFWRAGKITLAQMRISMKRALSFRGSFPGFPGRRHGKLSFGEAGLC